MANAVRQSAPPTPPDAGVVIPNKLYFRIGEVAELAGVEPHVLRFWQSAFPQLAPRKSGTGQRLYRRKEVELVLLIKDLLYRQRFTIEGARKHLEAQTQRRTPTPTVLPEPQSTPPTLADIRRTLLEVLALLR